MAASVKTRSIMGRLWSVLALDTATPGGDGPDILRATLTDASGAALDAAAGVVASASFTPAAAAYSAGDIIDVAKEFSFTDRNGVLTPAGSLIRVLSSVIKISVSALQANEAAYTLRLYSVTPPSARADNDPWTLAANDLAAYRGSLALGTPVDEGACLYIKTQYLDSDINLASGKTSIFGELQTVAGFTATAVARQVILYGIVL